MPIIVDLQDPYSDEVIQGCWGYLSILSLDFNKKTGSVVYDVHKNKSSAYNGKPPIVQIEFPITKISKPPVYGPTHLISPYVPAVYSEATYEEDGVTIITPSELITPEQLPVYSQPELLENGIPGFDEGVVANGAAYMALMSYFDSLVLSRPNIVSGVIEVE